MLLITASRSPQLVLVGANKAYWVALNFKRFPKTEKFEQLRQPPAPSPAFPLQYLIIVQIRAVERLRYQTLN